MGDPMELRIHGYELTLRLDDAAQITVTPTEKTPAVHARWTEKWWSTRVLARAASTTPRRGASPAGG